MELVRDDVERLRVCHSELCDLAKQILRGALPNVTALQAAKTHFSPRLMLLMHSRAAPEMRTELHQQLGETLKELERMSPVLGRLIVVLDEDDYELSVAEYSECRASMAFLQGKREALLRLLTTSANSDSGE